MKKTECTPLIYLSVISMLFTGLATPAIAAGRPMPPGNVGDNIALGKPYTLSPAPNYAYCTDAGDATQLTDGQYTSGYFWTHMSTVGWGWPTSTPTIIIDLGEVQPINGVSYHTAGGAGGVQWPSAINVLVSNDAINYYSVGDLVSLSNTQHNDAPPDGVYSLHYYNAALQTHGRYVKFEVVRQGGYVFVDEIAIYRGDNSYLGQNIAIERSYTTSPTPNYIHCTDAGDATQLTDGLYTSGYFWTQLSTVGWQFTSVDWISIEIDLGQILPIEGVSLNTAAGTAGVQWPMAISVLVSDDGVNYYNAGELVSLSSEHGLPSPSGYLVRSYWTDRLATHGRYVKIMTTDPERYFFADEIEVFQGNGGMLTQPSRGTVVADMTNCVKKNNIRGGTARRIVLDANAVQAQADAQTGLQQAVRDQIYSLLDTSCNDAIYLPDSDPSTFRAVLPLNASHSRVFRALSKLWQAQGKTGLIAWQTSSPWDPLDPTQAPATSGTAQVNVIMLQNEYRAEAFNLSNASDNNLTVTLNIQGLPGGTNPSYITVHEVAWTDSVSGAPIASALPVAASDASGFTVSIPSGMTRQIWLTFHPTITNPGTFSGTIVASSTTADTVNIPMNFQLSSLGFPAQPTLGLGGFDYTNGDTYSGMTLQNRDALIAHLREHFVDTTWGSPSAMPSPATFTNFDAWAARWPGVRNYRIFLNVGTTFNGYSMGSAQFNTAVANWVNAYVGHWQGMGLNLNQFALHLVDEPTTAAQADTLIQWANAIHAVQPNLKIWNDPVFPDPSVDYAQSMYGAVDMLCPNRTSFVEDGEAHRNVFRQQLAAGKPLEFYSCLGPASELDPYSYYRLQAWTCSKENASAMHYWSFDGKDSWNEYGMLRSGNFGTFFLDAATVTAGKSMEAIREGIEDYEYRVMLKNRISELEAAGSTSPLLGDARTLRDSVADTVLNAIGAAQWDWASTKDRGVADQKRIEILDMLEALGPQTNDNIAKGKTYTLSPAPNYAYCTDAGDATQLTAGNYTSGYFWTQLSTVGWRYPSSAPTITIDLGSIHPIKGVSYNTAAGAAGVHWPTAINMSVSNDGTNYQNIGELVAISNAEHSDGPAGAPYAVHRYWTKQLATYGRFVKIAVTGSPFLFVDEIEIYRN